MSYEIISAEFEVLIDLEKKLLDGTIENRRDFWKKVTDINQKLSHATNLKDTDYEKFKEQLEVIVGQVKEHQLEKERYYTALREQLAYNKTTFEKEIAGLTTRHKELLDSDSDELTSNNYYNNLKKTALRLKTIRPFDKEVRAHLLDEIGKIITQTEEKRTADKEGRIGESEVYKTQLFAVIDGQLESLKNAAEHELQKVYDQFFNEMEKIKNDLSSEKMIKKHVDQSWKHWKKVKEDAKALLAEVEKKYFDQVNADIENFVAKLATVSNPKEAFDQYKKIQAQAIKAPMKRRQKDKIFRRFKSIWAQMQEKFESHYKEQEELKAAREAERQKQAEKIVKKKQSEAQDLEGEVKELEETVNRLKTEIKNSQSQTFVRKANEVLAINENRLYEMKKRLDRLKRDTEKA